MNLEQIRSPKDLRGLTHAELHDLSAQIRERIIQIVSRNGGHLASNLGIVEMTLALHRVFESPQDRIIFDVGHQCYTHKLITGRIDPFPTLRTLGGLSGFPKMCESPHDAFDTGHSSTSISAALGMALARDHFDQAHKIVAVIGDGAMTGGMAFEALNYGGHKRSPFIVILNDNAMSISPNVGGLSHYLHKIRMEPVFTTPKEYLSHVVRQIPGFGSRVYQILSRLEGSLKYLLTPGSLFEELGFRYLGPIDGYDFALMEQTFAHARQCAEPILIHVLTEKGRGYKPAQDKLPQFHGVGPFEITTGEIIKEKAPPSFSSVFGQALVDMARTDSRIVAITAAMKEGTGLAAFAQHFPERFYDVGIAEQNAITMAAGMAAAGLRPYVAVYSTFLQRAYDQVIHDVALMNLPVTF
ncbi:MAG TPA: 1-deoxy-D-xylulose-5-phosphate synthase, partial [Candidatus Ozemobacteraceae bacterium]|nr:1-deoxy-D-xylulose-5-phosphate synthase [Candidatus Ozemobacteraceae bacterium]